MFKNGCILDFGIRILDLRYSIYFIMDRATCGASACAARAIPPI
ncbi:hypothetical protein D1AOALGA4SA_10609 [Olavius algarvensis Delta 1 endosymbiont]|nr:hypothetical protein D1AOALGA4SA_10609 [Olavius algarvensis Delta 1 endosymbiont]